MTARRFSSRVVRTTELAPGTIELELERNGFTFRAGEELILHGSEPEDNRIYSVASGVEEPTVKLLIRVIPGGRVTPRLAALQTGAAIDFSGPHGSFVLRDPARPALIVATGTGLAPFRSMLLSHPTWRPRLLHGVRYARELYYRAELEPRCAAYTPCVSGDPSRPLRVTDALTRDPPDPDCDVYLCGGQPMIRDVRALLIARQHPADCIFAEPYYFW